MNSVSHSKCKKCHIVSNISELKNNENGEGKICIDTKSCEERVTLNKKSKTN